VEKYNVLGSVSAKPRLSEKSKVDKVQFANYVDQHSNSRLCDLGEKFNISGVAVSYTLKKLGYSFKKPITIWRLMKNNVSNI
jgi:transposase